MPLQNAISLLIPSKRGVRMWRSKKTIEAVLRVFKSNDELIVFDVETTGFSAEKDRIIQFSGIKFRISDGNLVEKERFDTYINPGYPLPEKITAITGITDEMLRRAKCENEVFPKIALFLGNGPVSCGHNAAFDVRFIKALYGRNGCEFEPPIVLDTLEMARDLSGGKAGSNKLGALADYYGVSAGLTFHNSMDDVIACSRLLNVFYKEYKEKEEEMIESVTEECGIPNNKTRAKVYKLSFWQGYRGNSRIYVFTSLGDFFYDIRKKAWDKGKNNVYDIDNVDMEQLKADSLKLAKATDEKEFARFRG